MIWKAFTDAKVPSCKENMPIDWEAIPDTPFLKVKIKGFPDDGDKKYFYIHKPTLRLFQKNPFEKEEFK